MINGWRGLYHRYKDFFLNIVVVYKQRRDLRAFLELILSLSTVIILVVFALKPTVLTIVELYGQINNKRETISTLNKKISDLQKASDTFGQNQQYIPNVNAVVFGSPEPNTVSKQIQGIASKNSVILLGISIGQITITGKGNLPKASVDLQPLPTATMAMPVSINLKGNYSNIIAFIKDFENLRIPSKVDSLTINSSQNQDGTSIVGVITARIPYIGQQ